MEWKGYAGWLIGCGGAAGLLEAFLMQVLHAALSATRSCRRLCHQTELVAGGPVTPAFAALGDQALQV